MSVTLTAVILDLRSNDPVRTLRGIGYIQSQEMDPLVESAVLSCLYKPSILTRILAARCLARSESPDTLYRLIEWSATEKHPLGKKRVAVSVREVARRTSDRLDDQFMARLQTIDSPLVMDVVSAIAAVQDTGDGAEAGRPVKKTRIHRVVVSPHEERPED